MIAAFFYLLDLSATDKEVLAVSFDYYRQDYGLFYLLKKEYFFNGINIPQNMVLQAVQ